MKAIIQFITVIIAWTLNVETNNSWDSLLISSKTLPRDGHLVKRYFSFGPLAFIYPAVYSSSTVLLIAPRRVLRVQWLSSLKIPFICRMAFSWSLNVLKHNESNQPIQSRSWFYGGDVKLKLTSHPCLKVKNLSFLSQRRQFKRRLLDPTPLKT